MKKTFKILAVAVFSLACLASAQAQNYAYNSFINGYNLVDAATAANTTVTNLYGGTNTANSFGVNNYVYPGTYPVSPNNAYIGTNTIFGTQSAFGLYTNTSAIADARLWPDLNANLPTEEALFVSATGVNNTAANVFTLTFASVVDVPVPTGSGTITNSVACTAAPNVFAMTITANGTTPVNIITNLPSSLLTGAAKLRLISCIGATNAVGYATNTFLSNVLTNGVWQNVTNTVYSTNYGGIYLNCGIVGFPPFRSP